MTNTTDTQIGTVDLNRGFGSMRNARRLADGTVEYRDGGRWITAAPQTEQTFTAGPWL